MRYSPPNRSYAKCWLQGSFVGKQRASMLRILTDPSSSMHSPCALLCAGPVRCLHQSSGKCRALAPMVCARPGHRRKRQTRCDNRRRMSVLGLVSRASPVQTAVRNCTRDEGGPFGFGDQVADPKRPQAAVVKSHGGERCGNAGTMIPAGTVERGERKRTVSEVSKAD